MGGLDGKVAVITGAGGGMGREAALLFSEEGAQVCAADVNEEANRLDFGVIDESTRQEAIARLTALGIPSDAYVVEIAELGIVLEQCPLHGLH